MASPASCIIDTGILIDFLRGRSYTVELFRQIVREGEMAISAVSQVEIYATAQTEAFEVTDEVLDGFVTVDVTPPIARQAGMLLNQARARGEQADIADAIIAASALVFDLPLVTNQTGRYRFPGVNLVRGQAALRRV